MGFHLVIESYNYNKDVKMLGLRYYVGVVRGTRFKTKLYASGPQEARDMVAREFQILHPREYIRDILASVSVKELRDDYF